MPITIVPRAEPSPGKLFALQSGRGFGAAVEAAVGQKRPVEEQGEARQDLIAAFIASETILPSPARAGAGAAAGATADGAAAEAPTTGGAPKAGPPAGEQAAATAAGAGGPGAACTTSAAMDASPAAALPPPPAPLPPSAHSTTGDAVAEVPAVCEDASLAATAGSTAATLLTASAVSGSTAACRSLDFVRSTEAAGPAALAQHPAELPAPAAYRASKKAAAPAGFGKSLSRRLSRKQASRVAWYRDDFHAMRTSLLRRASTRRILRREDSPPVPRRRALPDSPGGRGSPASATPHLPSIAEAEGPGTDGHAAGGAAPKMAGGAAAPAVPAGAAAGVSAAAAPRLAAQHPAAHPAEHESLQEVDLREAPAPHDPPRRRISGLSCACFAGTPVR
ncbi:hypothetical protein ABPG75_010011 [Micractinium tetrahymenae]